MQEGMLEGYRLSPQQRHLWGLLRHGSNAAYLTKCAVAIKGQLKNRYLKSSAQNLITRHEILRTTFQCLPGMTIPMQVINETGGFLWQEGDLSALDRRASLIDDCFHATSGSYNFEQGPFLSIHLIKRAKDDHIMIVRLPAICSDSVGMRNLVAELSGSYASAMRKEKLDSDVLQYADLAEWQNGLIGAEETQLGREYWESLNLLCRPTPQLAFERVTAKEMDFEPCVHELEIGPSLTAKIESVARSLETSLEKILLACWYVLLWRHTGQSEIEIGSVFDGRRASEIEDALGIFAKYLPVTCHLEEGLQFGAFIEQIDQALLTVRNRQEYFSWEQFVAPSASAPRAPFFPFCFEPETPPASFLAGAVTFTIFKLYACIDRFKIKLSYARRSEGLVIEFHYDSELFRSADIQCLSGHFQALLESAIANPAARIGALEMVNDAELRRLFIEYNSTKTEWPRDKFVHELFLDQMKRTPEAVAVIYEGERLTYRELNERAAALAHYLRGSGVAPEVIVGLCLDRSLDLVVSLLAVLKAGGAYLPLDPSYPQERLSFILEDAAVKVLLTERRLRSRLPTTGRAQVICVEDLWKSISQASARECETTLSPENLAYVIYTSGSTGRPKGVMLRHRSLKNYLLWAIDHYSAGVGCGAPVHSSLSFDLTITSLFTPLLVGGHVHLLSAANEIESLGAALSERPGYSLVKLTPAHLQLLAEQLSDIDLDGAAHSFVIGGENLPAQSVRRWREKASAIRLFNEYGPTESVVGCCVYEVGAKVEVEDGRATVPVGRPIANTGLHILDGGQRPAPQGVVGELCVSGEGLARGYLNRPDLTAERFAPSPYLEEPGARLYRTGDLARYLRDRQIEILGRMDSQVKVRGYRVELGEIEAVLRDIPEVGEAVVVAVSEDGQNRLIGYVVGNEEQKPDTARLRKRLQERLPEYMIPATLLILDALPLTQNGKIDRTGLPSAKDVARRLESGEVGARTPVEEILAGVFWEVLKVDRVGIHDNFFELGGHSLLATQVVSRVRDVFGVGIGVRSVFEESTAARLAKRVEEAMRAGEKDVAPPLVRAPREERPPLSFAQRRLWFIEQLDPGNAVYNIPGAVRLEGSLNLEALEKAINEIVRRHEVLRTRILVEAGEPAQVIDEWKPQKLEREDLTNLPPEERESEVRRMVREETEMGFDLGRGPLLRVKVLKLEEKEHVALFTMHHIVSDGWSKEILSREVGALYQAYSAGEESPLEELPIQYADFAVWQRAYLAGGVMESEVGYWKDQLKGAAALDLPTDRARPAMLSHRGGMERVEIGKEVMEGLRKLSRREGATTFMALMAAFKTLLMRYSGEEDISIGTVVANRTRREVEGLIGFFVNALVMRTNLGGNPSFREMLAREKEVALGAYMHQEVPFEKLVEEINPERDLSRNPLFQVTMMLQNTGGEEVEMKELEVSGIGEGTGTAKFDLMLNLKEAGDGVVGGFVYSQDLFEGETIRRMARRYERVALEVVRDAEQRIREIELMSDEEKKQILESGTGAEVEYERDICVHWLFEEQVERSPEAVAVICEEERVSYRELNRRANQLGHYLRKLGVGPEVMVGVCLERSIEIVVALMGVWKAGGAYLPMDPSYPEQRLRLMTEDAGVGVVVTSGEAREKLQKAQARVLDLGVELAEVEKCGEGLPYGDVGGENLAYVIYTSGSTGEPKGVMVSHRNLTSLLKVSERSFEFEAEEEMLCLASFAFDISLFELLNPLVTGGKVNILSRERILGMGELLVELKKVSGIHAVPTLMKRIVERVKIEGENPQSYGNIKKVFVGGELVPTDLLGELREIFKEARIEVLYGPTEGTVICASDTVRAGGAGGKNIIGRPLNNVGIRICDDNSELAPIGVRGELRIVGEGVARGYLKRPELTAGRFTPDAHGLEPGARAYRTGDLGRLGAGGEIEFLGRGDDQVKVRGFRIELGEIEAVLNEHGTVKQSAVVLRVDERGDQRLLGYVVGEEGVTESSLRIHLRKKLPEYMVPEAIIILEEMPVTVNGKIDRKRLPRLSDGAQSTEKSYVAPRDALELQLAQIWERLLDLRPIGVTDNFFDLGGHSLLAVSLMLEIRKVVGQEAPLSALFQGGTIERLASIMRREAGYITWPSLVEFQASGSLPPLFFVPPAGGNALCYLELARCLSPDRPFYGFQTPGLYGERAIFTGIENLAAHYIEAMKTIQPEGPYFLGGWSVGGIVAFEMAQQLSAQGQKVSQLLLLDAAARIHMEEPVEGGEEEEERIREDDAEIMIGFFGEAAPISREDLERLEGDERIDYIIKKAVSVNLLPSDIEVAQVRHFLGVYKANGEAMRKYVPQSYPGAVTLFKTAAQLTMPPPDGSERSERIAKIIQDPTKGWGALAVGGVRVIDVPGEHHTIVSRPHVETLALRIGEHLSETEAGGAANC